MKYHSTLSRAVPLAFVLSSFSGFAIAQDKEEERNRALRIIAVGEAPPWDEKTVDGPNGRVRVQQEPPAGSVPPYYLQIANKEGVGEGDPVRIVLDRITDVIPVGSVAVPLHKSEADGGAESTPWHTIKYPRTARAALGILWRDPRVGKWDKALSLTLPDDTTSFPAGRMRIINVSGADLGLDIDGKRGKLGNGQVFMHAPKDGNAHLKVNVRTRSGWAEVADQAVNQSARERTNVILYRADGEAPRRPVKAVVLREIAKTPEVPKKRR